MKPKLLLCLGTAYSATTPLYYTLSVDQRYCHGGYDKEYKQLYLDYLRGTSNYRHYLKHQFRRMFQNKVKTHNEFGGERQRHPDVHYTNPFVKFTEEEKEYFFNPPTEISKYIEYFTKHYENIKGTYESVCDFSTDYGYFTQEHLSKIAPQLKEAFDVKVVMIFRDPVRRLFSQCQKAFYGMPEHFKPPFDTAVEYFFHLIETDYDRSIICTDDKKSIKTAYKDMIDNWNEHFDVHYFAMEDLHTEQDTVDALSDYLEYPIKIIHENVYFPEMGSSAPKLDYLADQWMSDFEDLSEQQLKKARQLLDVAYTSYPGKLSSNWICSST